MDLHSSNLYCSGVNYRYENDFSIWLEVIGERIDLNL